MGEGGKGSNRLVPLLMILKMCGHDSHRIPIQLPAWNLDKNRHLLENDSKLK